MAIISDISLKINGFNAKMSHTLEFYKGDSLTLTFLITHSMIQKVKNYDATQEVPVKFIKSKLLIQTPSQMLHVDDMNNNEDNRCVFHLPSDYTQEIGDYKLQIVLYSNADGEVIHLPDIKMSIAEPIALVTLDDNPGTSLLLTLNDDFLTTASGEKILYSNGTGTTNKSISDLDEKTTVNNEDYLIIETPNSTNKIKFENLIKDLTSSSSVTEDITVTGMEIGSFKNGDVISAGTSIQDVLKKLLVKETYPTYTAPTLSLTADTMLVEYDDVKNITFNHNFVQNDAGNALGKHIRYGMVDDTMTEPYVLTNWNFTSDLKVTAEVSYDDGPIKQTNTGKDYPTGSIKAGIVKKDLTIKISVPAYAYSADGPVASIVPTGIAPRLGLKKGSQLVVVTRPIDKFVYFVYPESLGNASKIRFDNINDDENISAFTLSSVTCPSKNGTGVNKFKVYKYESLVPFGQECKFILTI